jgi:hypothetical protein
MPSSLPWSDVDLQNRTIQIRHTKNHTPFTLPISDYLTEILSSRKDDFGGNDRVFPIEEPRRFVQRVREDSGVGFTIHDLRRTFITIAESMDISLFAIKALVNHRSNTGTDVTAGYVQFTTERLRKGRHCLLLNRGFESFRAHHFHRNHRVMAFGTRDRNPLVYVVAGTHAAADRNGSTGATGVEDMAGLSSIEIYCLYSHQHSIQLLFIYPVLLYSHRDHPDCVYSDGD